MFKSYNDVLIFRNHLSAFVKLMSALPDPNKPGAFEASVELWRKTCPESPILKSFPFL